MQNTIPLSEFPPERLAVPTTISAADFGARPDTGEDACPGARAAISECRRSGACRLSFAPGRYDFWPDRASEHYLFASNNDEGLKRIAFFLRGIENLEIDGNGAFFLFHGKMVPFVLENCKNLTLKNFSFDFERPFHSEGTVTAISPTGVDLQIGRQFPYEIRHGVLLFSAGESSTSPGTTVDGGGPAYPVFNLLAYDQEKRETAFMARDLYGLPPAPPASSVSPGIVRLHVADVPAKPGDRLVFGAPRHYPGILISDSQEVRLENIAIHHCGGMGVIAQRSADLSLDRVKVTPPPGGQRIVSATADATHFVNCRGSIELRDCVFEQQMDDASNIHGLYAKVTRILAPDRFEVRLVHPQQAGVDFIGRGATLEITDGPSLQPKGLAEVRRVIRLNKEYSIVETASPAKVAPGDAISDADANTAEVRIRGCLFRGNRARGLLLGSRGRTIVEDCTFHTPGSAILFEGDATYWFEQAGVSEAIIRNNTFDNCNFGVWGKACIEVRAGIGEKFRPRTRYNRNISVTGNRFRVFGAHPLLDMYSVEGLTCRENFVEITEEYPAPKRGPVSWFEVGDCDRVALEAPVVMPSPQL